VSILDVEANAHAQLGTVGFYMFVAISMTMLNKSESHSAKTKTGLAGTAPGIPLETPTDGQTC
jgi:hypothetical protein